MRTKYPPSGRIRQLGPDFERALAHLVDDHIRWSCNVASAVAWLLPADPFALQISSSGPDDTPFGAALWRTKSVIATYTMLKSGETVGMLFQKEIDAFGYTS